MAGEFFVEKGVLSGVILVLDEGKQWTIGRDPSQCDLLLEDPHVERKHLLCRKTEEGYTLQDISEGQKTLLNGRPLTGEQTLGDADEIAIEKVILRFFEESISPVVVGSVTEQPRSAEMTTLLERLERNSQEEEASLPPKPEDFPNEQAEEEGAFDEPLEAESVEEDPIEQTPPGEKELPKEALSAEELLEDVLAEEEVVEEEPLADEVIKEGVNEPTAFEQVEEFHIDLTQTVRFILKVIAGPNTGAEFAIDTDKHYLIGT